MVDHKWDGMGTAGSMDGQKTKAGIAGKSSLWVVEIVSNDKGKEF